MQQSDSGGCSSTYFSDDDRRPLPALIRTCMDAPTGNIRQSALNARARRPCRWWRPAFGRSRSDNPKALCTFADVVYNRCAVLLGILQLAILNWRNNLSRYIIADPDAGNGWGHIFSEGDAERERVTRFVFDSEASALIHLDVYRGSVIAATDVEIADVEDSLKNANIEALENPEDWGLIGSDTLPPWCPQLVAGTTLSR
jgi:hypothetical protein